MQEAKNYIQVENTQNFLVRVCENRISNTCDGDSEFEMNKYNFVMACYFFFRY